MCVFDRRPHHRPSSISHHCPLVPPHSFRSRHNAHTSHQLIGPSCRSCPITRRETPCCKGWRQRRGGVPCHQAKRTTCVFADTDEQENPHGPTERRAPRHKHTHSGAHLRLSQPFRHRLFPPNPSTHDPYKTCETPTVIASTSFDLFRPVSPSFQPTWTGCRPQLDARRSPASIKGVNTSLGST
jgi:hypothetical protein